MDIARTSYLNQLIEARGDGKIKIISGLRRCGKSYLLKRLFKQYLLDSGVPQKHIILIDLEQRKNSAFLDPDYLQDYVENAMVDDDTYYVLLDEVQRVEDFTGVLASLLLKENIEIYVTGSNSRFLSSDIATEFRGLGPDDTEDAPLFPDVWDQVEDRILAAFEADRFPADSPARILTKNA